MGNIAPDNLDGPHVIASDGGRQARQRQRWQCGSPWPVATGRGLRQLEKARKQPSLEFQKEHGSADTLAFFP